LACLGYWLIEDTKKKGFLSMKEILPLLEAFRFEIDGLSSFRREFNFLMKQNPGEVRMETAEEDVVIRFDLVRQIFLERGL